jgi:hypothetical protein
MEMAYPNDIERAGEWRKMAERMHIPLDEDPDLRSSRRKRVQEDLEAMFGPMPPPGTTVE